MTLPLSDEPVNALRYQDLNTGCVYELDETTGLYGLVYCPPGVTSTGILGNYLWSADRGTPPSGHASLTGVATSLPDGTVLIVDGDTAYLVDDSTGDYLVADA